LKIGGAKGRIFKGQTPIFAGVPQNPVLSLLFVDNQNN
jgi:hypothetical protein